MSEFVFKTQQTGSFCTNKTYNFLEKWQLHNEVKIRKVNKARPGASDGGLEHQFQPDPNPKIQAQLRIK